MIDEAWVKRKREAVAAHGSKSYSRSMGRGITGVVDLIKGFVPDDEERCLANCPVDMAKASRSSSGDRISILVSGRDDARRLTA